MMSDTTTTATPTTIANGGASQRRGKTDLSALHHPSLVGE